MAAKTNQPPAAGDAPARSGLMLVIKGLLLVCALQFFGLSYFLYQKKTQPPGPGAAPVLTVSSRAGNQDTWKKCEPGPWGDLEYARLPLVAPEDLNPGALPATEWHFPAYNIDRLDSLLRSAGLTNAQQTAFLHSSSTVHLPDRIVVRPDEHLVLGLTPEARKTIYSELATYAANPFHRIPYTFRRGELEELFQGSGVPPRVQALVKGLTYQRAESVCFSDLREVLAITPKETERQALMRALARRPGILLKLRVPTGSKLAEVIRFWAKGPRSQDTAAMLEAAARIPGGGSIDISQLLPPFARSHLNVFPPENAPDGIRQPDCYWAAMNFFKETPAPIPGGGAWQQDLAENYTQVQKPAFGDLVFLVQSDGRPHHAGVFIADDVVFTQGAGRGRQPWLLVKVGDLRALFPGPEPLKIVLFTPKKPWN